MTLLWATDVIDREMKRQDDQALRTEYVGPARGISQACRELDELFKIRSMRQRSGGDRRVSFVSRGGSASGTGTRTARVMQKWGLEFEQDG